MVDGVAAEASQQGQLREKERGTSGIVIRGIIKTRFRCSGDRPDTHLRSVVCPEREKEKRNPFVDVRNLWTGSMIGLTDVAIVK